MTTKNENTSTNPAPGPQSTKTLVPQAAKQDEGAAKIGETPKHAVSDNTPDEGSPKELTRDEEAKLQALLDDDSDEPKWPDDGRVPDHHRDSFAAAKKFQKLAAAVPSDTPDEHMIWGAGGVTITVGDLRALVKTMPTS